MWPYSISRVSSVLDDHVEKHRLCRSCERKIHKNYNIWTILDPNHGYLFLGWQVLSPTDNPNFVRWFHHIPPHQAQTSLVFIVASLLAALQLAALCAADLLVELSSWELKVKVWKDGQCWRLHEFDPMKSLNISIIFELKYCYTIKHPSSLIY